MNEQLKIARINARLSTQNTAVEIMRIIASNAVLCGITALGINHLAYKAGLYNVSQQEADQTSVLGGPVWFTIGPTQTKESVASSRASAVAGFIIAASTAQAAAPILTSLVSK
jgi:hypothetical protein